MKKSVSGFTIVELLIVIIVIGILAAITVMAYNGIQTRARDNVRSQDIKTIVKALELHYAEKGYFPNVATTGTGGSTVINSGWTTTADSSWASLFTALSPYISKLPTPPGTPASGASAAGSGANSYDYFGFSDSSYCGSTAGQGFLLVYHNDGPQGNTLVGNCTGTPVGPYGTGSNYRVVK